MLPDGWEIANGLDPNDDADGSETADADGDGATNREEYSFNSDPNNIDTDGDGTVDGVEIGGPDGDPDTPGGSNPNDPSDNGQPLPDEEQLAIRIGVGDQSGSMSEDYVMNIYRLNRDTGSEERFYTLRSGGHGQYKEIVLDIFRKSDTYTFQIDWQSSSLNTSGSSSNPDGPDFDYTFKVEPQNDETGILIDSYYPVGQYADTANPIGGDKNDVEDFQEKVETKRIARLAVDLDIIKPGTEGDAKPTELSEKEEDFKAASGGNAASGGGVASLNWDDDDQDGGAGGHQQLNFVNDFNDENGTAKEDDLIQIKVHRVMEDDVKGRLKFNANHFRVWKKKDRTEEIKTEDTEFPIKKNEDLILYVEGKKLTAAEAPEKIELQVKIADVGGFIKKEEVSLHVATPIILCAGWAPEEPGTETSDIAKVLSSNEGLGTKRIDKRKNTSIYKGKSQDGKLLFYQIDLFDVKPERNPNEGDDGGDTVKVRQTNLDKEMKMALSLEGAHAIFSGHSNFGLGPNFNPQGTTTVDDYMNLSSHGVAGIILKSDDPDEPEPFKPLEHGGPNFALRPADILGNTTNPWVELANGYKVRRYPSASLTFTKTDASGGIPAHHFIQQGQHKNWVTIVNSTGDKPTLRYASCFMNSCNSGRHFGHVLNRKVFFYTSASSYSFIEEPEPEYNKPSIVLPSVFSSYIYIERLVEGKSWASTATFLTDHQGLQTGDVKIPNLYQVSQ